MSVDWIFFPLSSSPPDVARSVVRAFDDVHGEIDSDFLDLSSNGVLAKLTTGLQGAGFEVETGKKKDDAIPVPVLFGTRGSVLKSFNADAWNRSEKMVLEVEAGTGVANSAFLKDLFQACMMHDVDLLGIALRKHYKRNSNYDYVVKYFETLYASRRLQLPLSGVLLIGY